MTESQTDIDEILHLGNFGTYNGACVSNQRLENVSIKETCIQLSNDNLNIDTAKLNTVITTK